MARAPAIFVGFKSLIEAFINLHEGRWPDARRSILEAQDCMRKAGATEYIAKAAILYARTLRLGGDSSAALTELNEAFYLSNTY